MERADLKKKKPKCNILTKEGWKQNPEYHRWYYLKNRERILARTRKYLASHREQDNKRSREYCRRMKEYRKKYYSRKNWQLKLEVLSHYSNPICCGGCKFTDPRCLTIDHINGRKNSQDFYETGKKLSGVKLYKWLKDNNFPKGYQVLCRNCNYLKYCKESD